MSEIFKKIEELNRFAIIQSEKMKFKEKEFKAKMEIEAENSRKLKQQVSILEAELLQNCDLLVEKELKKKDEEFAYIKNKIKSHYNQEIEKIKSKHVKEVKDLRTEVFRQSRKVKTLEAYIPVLSNKNYKLNEANLEILRENEFLKKKLCYKENLASTRGQYDENVRKEDFNNFFCQMKPAATTTSKRSPESKNRLPFGELNSPNLPKSILKVLPRVLPTIKVTNEGRGTIFTSSSPRVQFEK